ncbi:phage tail tip lysozyme [Sphingobium sp. YG1]|uniref:phage tail tip lysozyme n=1 Tax=Sphingobium sp. YG1 TaxID=2082188 RepID=UPI000DBB2423|nr:phage tail tip lysozyme [Sphingobium sp. YG1]BBC99092.1 hypothetical protein YGS_C1P0348 [Sphingobium sp. YG1]
MTGVFDPDWQDPRQGIQPAQRPATYGEVWSASRTLARGDRVDAEAERLRREYEPVLTAVNADRARRGLKPMVNPGYWQNAMERRASADRGSFDFGSMFDPRVTRDEQQAAIFGEIGAIRARDPKFLSGIPNDLGSFRKGIIDREKAARAGARDVIGRSSGVGQTVTGFAGGVWETMHDPVNIASLPLGGGTGTVWVQAGRSALINGGLELVQQPIVADNREQLGEELTLGEASLNTLMGAVGGVVGDVVLPQAVKGIAKGIGAVADAVTPLDRKVATALSRANLDGVSDGELADVFGRHVTPDMRTPDERAAIHVIERDAEIRASSPFEPTPEGMDAHAAQMQASMEAIIRANTADAPIRIPPVVPGGMTTAARPRLKMSGGRLAADVVGFFQEKGYSEAQARGIAAGIAAESASNHAALNPTSGAMGLGQWLGPRKAELIRRYGPNPTRRQQLEFLHHELQGGDHGGRKVLAQADEAGALRAYVQDFMRPAKGAETTGDLRRGMAALGREMEDIAGVDARVIDVEGEVPVLRDPAMDAERVSIDAPDRAQIEIDYADLPTLRRDMFADDRVLQAEQAAQVREMLGTPERPVEDVSAPYPVDPVVPTVRDDASTDALLSFYPTKGEPGIEIIQEGGHYVSALWRDADGISQAYVQLPVSAEARDILNEVSTHVRPAFRRQGVATKLYDALEDAGFAVDRLSGEGDLTPAGAAFVNKRRAARREMPGAIAPTSAARDDIAAARIDGPAIAAEARQLDLFSEPHGEGASLQAESLAHDMRALLDAAEGDTGAAFRIEDGNEISIADILADLDEDRAVIETIRSCL